MHPGCDGPGFGPQCNRIRVGGRGGSPSPYHRGTYFAAQPVHGLKCCADTLGALHTHSHTQMSWHTMNACIDDSNDYTKKNMDKVKNGKKRVKKTDAMMQHSKLRCICTKTCSVRVGSTCGAQKKVDINFSSGRTDGWLAGWPPLPSILQGPAPSSACWPPPCRPPPAPQC